LAESVKILRLGIKKYQEVWDFQTEIHQSLIKNRNLPMTLDCIHTLILCQHHHVYTLGKSGTENHLLADIERLKNIHAEFVKINRGGDITYHGPGQLVVYPILDLNRLFTDVHKYVRFLEEVVIQVCEYYSIDAGRIEGFTGVWVDRYSKRPRKICAIGVHLSRWVSLHGLAFNISTDLDYFNYIVPCGILSSEKTVTSLERELGREVKMDEIEELFIEKFITLFELEKLN